MAGGFQGLNKKDYLLFAIVFIVLLGLFVYLPPLSLYSDHEGLGYVQMKNFYLNRSLSISYPGEKLGLVPGHITGNQEYLIQKEGGIYCILQPLFPYLSSLFYPIFGDRVTHFLPFLTFFLSIVVLSMILRLLINDERVYWMLLFGFLFGSPVLFYAFTFWEFVPMIFLILLGLYLMVLHFHGHPSRVFLFFSTFIIGLTPFFRPEAVLFVFSYGVCATFVMSMHERPREAGALALGVLVPLLGFLIFNYAAYGDILGLEFPYRVLVAAMPMKKLAVTAGAIAGFVALLFLCKRDTVSAAGRKNIYAFIPVLLVGFILVFYGESPIKNLIFVFPALLLVFVGFSEKLEEAREKGSTVGTILLGSIIVYMCLIALIFSPVRPDYKFALPLVPLVFVFLASEQGRIFSSRAVRGVFLAFALYAAAHLALNINNDLRVYKNYNAARIEFLKQHTSDGDVVIFQWASAMYHAGPLFFERVYMVASGAGGGCGAKARRSAEDELLSTLSILRDRKVKTCYFWTGEPQILKGQKKFRVETAIFSPEGMPQHFLHKIYVL